MNAFKSGWFTELCPSGGDYRENNKNVKDEILNNGDVGENGINKSNASCGSVWSGQAISLKVDDEIYHKKSMYQDVRVFKR